jgi:hypothetical protein
MIKKILLTFIFFAPFTSFFALSAWMRIPVVLNQVLFLIVIIGIFYNNKIKLKWVFKEDVFLLLFLGLVWLSFLFGYLEKRSFNHSLAYTNAILFFFFTTKYSISQVKVLPIDIAKIMYWSFCTITLIIIVDFFGANFYNFELRKFFAGEPDGTISNMNYYIRGSFLRVGGVSEEPGHMALFYNIYFGISMYYLYITEQFHKYKWIIIFFLISHFALYSNAGITLFILATFFIFSYNKAKTLKISQKQIFFIATATITTVILIFFIFYFDIGGSSKVLKAFTDKIFFNESGKKYSSSGQRLIQWQRAFVNFFKHPIFGNGPGYGVHEDKEGYLSVYLTMLSDIGIIAFLLFMTFLASITQKVLNLPATIRNFMMFSLLTSVIHLIIIADFYSAPIWILFIFIQLVYKEHKKVKE